MSVPGYRANTSPVTSGYPCCNNLLVQVTPLKQTKLVFAEDTQGSLSGWSRPHHNKNEVEDEDRRENQVWPSIGAKPALLDWQKASRITANTLCSLGRSSIWQMWQQSPREEAIFEKMMEDGWRTASSKQHLNLQLQSSPLVDALFFFFFASSAN